MHAERHSCCFTQPCRKQERLTMLVTRAINMITDDNDLENAKHRVGHCTAEHFARPLQQRLLGERVHPLHH